MHVRDAHTIGITACLRRRLIDVIQNVHRELSVFSKNITLFIIVDTTILVITIFVIVAPTVTIVWHKHRAAM